MSLPCRSLVVGSDLEEELEDVPVGDPLGVEDDLDRLGVPRMVAVGRVLVLATGVADPGGDDSLALAQQLLDAPEAAAREDRGRCCHLLPSPCSEGRCQSRRPPPNRLSASRKMLKMSRKIAAAIGTAASGVLRRRRLKSKIVNAPKIPSPATA